MKGFTWGLLILMLLVPVAAFSSSPAVPHRLAVLNFRAMNCSEPIAGIARNAAEMKLFMTNRFEILEHQQVDKLITEKAGHAGKECSDARCLRVLGKLLKARYMVAGTVEKLDRWRITLRVFEVKSEKLIITASAESDTKEDIRECAEEAAEIIVSRLLNRWRGSSIKKYDISSAFIFAIPAGHLSRLCSYGYGFDLQGIAHNIFIQGLFIGGLFSYIHYEGKDENVHHSWMTALQATSGYGITFGPAGFRVFLAAGMGYNQVNYYTEADSDSRGALGGFQPVLRSGLSFSLKTGRHFWCSLGGAYGHIFDPGGSISWIQIQGRIALLF